MFQQTLAKIASSLKKHKIPYMVIGGQAVLLYGEPRLTRDIDITLGVNAGFLEELMIILEETELKPLPSEVEPFVKQTMVLPAIEENSGIRVDFIFSFTPYESQAITRAIKVKLEGQDVLFSSPEDLIIHKLFAGRPQDLEDTKSIILKNREINYEYIRQWLKEFDKSLQDSRRLKETFEKILQEASTQ